MPPAKRKRAPRGGAAPRAAGATATAAVARREEDEDLNSEEISGEKGGDEFDLDGEVDQELEDGDEGEEEEEEEEDVADKRLRLAREYLARVQRDVAERRGIDGDDDEEEEDDDAIAARRARLRAPRGHRQ